MIGFVCRDTACRVRWFRERNIPLETFLRNVSKIKKQQAGHKGTFPVRQKHGAGISLSADSDSEGCSPSENTSPAALSWNSLFGQTVLKSFRFCTMVFVTALAILQHIL